MRFAVVADVHFPSRAERADTFVKAISSDPTIEFVVVAGDLTDNGYDGKRDCSCLASMCGTPVVEDQLAEYIARFDAPLHAAGKHVYAVPGNTDNVVRRWRHPVTDFIRSRHGDTHYIVLREGIALVFCDVYPDAKVLAWFARELAHKPTLRNMPFAFFFHYNIHDASFGSGQVDDWTSLEKLAFRDAIKSLRVLGIFVGHLHATYAYKWNQHDVYCTGGNDRWAVVELVSNQAGDAAFDVTLQH